MLRLAVASCRDIGFEDSGIFYFHPAIGYGGQMLVGFVVEILRQIFRGRFNYREGLDFVDHLVIETFDGVLHHIFQVFEIEQQAGFVELRSRQGHADLVVVAVRILALAFVVAEVVSGGECVFYGYFVHEIGWPRSWVIVHFESAADTARSSWANWSGHCRSLAPLGMTIHKWVQVMSGMQAGITIREALASEAAIILHHRRSMFRDMGEGTIEELDRMVEVAAPWLARAMADGSYHHWLAVDESGRVAGGGGVLLCPWPANPHDACTQRAVILNVYTEIEFRKRGIARQVMLTILEWIKAQGLRGVNLHASAEGRGLYEKLGFEPTNEMRLKF